MPLDNGLSMEQWDQIGEDVVTACRILSHRRLVEAFGHFSARIPGANRFVVSPRRSLALVDRVSDLAVVSLDGDQVSGTPEAPLEIHIHSCIYRARPDVGAIARTHSFEHGKCSYGYVSDRKSTRLNSSHQIISYAVFCLKKKKRTHHA